MNNNLNNGLEKIVQKASQKALDSFVKFLGSGHPLTRAFNHCITYIPIGCSPGEVQKTLLKKAGIDNILTPSLYTIAVGYGYGLLQYFGGDFLINNPDILNASWLTGHIGSGGKFLGLFSFVNESLRVGYITSAYIFTRNKEPIGTLPLELLYWGGKKLSSFKRRMSRKKSLEDYESE